MATYWCESCPSRNFKNFRQLIKHLNGSPHYLGILKRGDSVISRGKIYRRIAARFQLENQKFNRLPDLLRYIDRQYGIHCCYVKGLARGQRVVFLDGATRE